MDDPLCCYVTTSIRKINFHIKKEFRARYDYVQFFFSFFVQHEIEGSTEPLSQSPKK